MAGEVPAHVSEAAIAVRAALAADIPERIEREWLKSAIWYCTATPGGKYEQRYATPAFLDLDDLRGVARHEHVVTVKWLRDAVSATPDHIESILSLAVGCNVTKPEHTRLTRFDRTHFGWERYLAAGIDVIDTNTGHPVDVDSLAASHRQVIDKLGLPTPPPSPKHRLRTADSGRSRQWGVDPLGPWATTRQRQVVLRDSTKWYYETVGP